MHLAELAEEVALLLGPQPQEWMDQAKPEVMHPQGVAMVVTVVTEPLELDRTAQHLVVVAVELSVVAALR